MGGRLCDPSADGLRQIAGHHGASSLRRILHQFAAVTQPAVTVPTQPKAAAESTAAIVVAIDVAIATASVATATASVATASVATATATVATATASVATASVAVAIASVGMHRRPDIL